MSGPIEVPTGLKGVAVARTAISDVDGEHGVYHYRGHDPVRLARERSFEEVWGLLLHGELPTPEEADAFAARVRDARRLPAELRDVLPRMATLSPLDGLGPLRTAVSAAGQALGCRPWLEQDPATTREQAFRLVSLVPVLAAALHRHATGREPVEPHPELPTAANLLYMIDQEVPSAERVQALERYLVLTVEHGFNNSTFTARVIVSSGADLGAALSGAIGAFSGPLHGGAVAKAPSMLDAVGDEDGIEDWIRATLDAGERLSGFGHPVYRTTDPRSELLRETASELGGPRIRLARAFERTAARLLNERHPDQHREANVDFYAGVVLGQVGVPEELFASVFTTARAVGWAANVLEQISSNAIFRPSAIYEGPVREPLGVG